MKNILVIFGLVATAAVSAAEEYATLSGIVSDEADNPIQWAIIRVEGTDVHLITLEDGTTSFADIPPGRYTVKCSAPGYVDSTIEDVLLVAGIRSTVTFILKRPPEDAVLTIEKPNIYLYPEESTEVSVRLDFPRGGGVTVSDPPYDDGWTVTVEPDGWIDTGLGYVVVPAGEAGGEEIIFDAPRYSYLFYEAETPDFWQRERGWLTTADVIGDFFAYVLREYGFRGREVDDFLEYWMPLLSGSLYYAVYPQTGVEIAPVVELRVEPEPTSVLRLFLLIEELDETTATADWHLPEPEIPTFEREGFAIVEWGVCLDGVIQ